MNDTIVTIRMPPSLYKDLRALISERRFLDLSEAVRSIVRSRYAHAGTLGTSKLESIKDELDLEKQQRRQAELRRQIERLSLELKNLGDRLD